MKSRRREKNDPWRHEARAEARCKGQALETNENRVVLVVSQKERAQALNKTAVRRLAYCRLRQPITSRSNFRFRFPTRSRTKKPQTAQRGTPTRQPRLLYYCTRPHPSEKGTKVCLLLRPCKDWASRLTRAQISCSGTRDVLEEPDHHFPLTL